MSRTCVLDIGVHPEKIARKPLFCLVGTLEVLFSDRKQIYRELEVNAVGSLAGLVSHMTAVESIRLTNCI